MENENIKFTCKVIQSGGSKILAIPPEIIEYLNLETKDEIFIMPENGKHGKFISIWKKEL